MINSASLIAAATADFLPIRKFGIEIETIGLDNDEVYELFSDTEWKDAGWDVKYDGSLSNGAEIVSPILQGQPDLENVKDVALWIQSIGQRVNSSAGLHVHVDVRDIASEDFFNKVLESWKKVETVVDTVLAPSRRENRNGFCHSLLEVADLADWEYSRYYKLNIRAYEAHGTLEFRAHQGTLNPAKMVAWVQFCLNFIQAIADGVEIEAVSTMAELCRAIGTSEEMSQFYAERAEELAG